MKNTALTVILGIMLGIATAKVTRKAMVANYNACASSIAADNVEDFIVKLQACRPNQVLIDIFF